MKNEFKKKKEYFPYRIFQKNEENKKLYLNVNSIEHSHRKRRKVAIDIYKNLKSMAKSTEIFSDYMVNYSTLTQDFCFKTPTNSVYPIRKNSRYLSAACLLDIKMKYKLNKNKRPMSAIVPNNNKLSERKFKIKVNQIKEKKKINFKRNNFYRNKSALSEKYNKSIDLDNDNNLKKKNFDFLVNYILNSKYKNNDKVNNNFNKTKLFSEGILSDENLKYQLSVYSICLKFKLINMGIKNNIYQKIYLQFKYLPIFYLLDFQLFKIFLSEIICYEQNNFYINNNDINQICDKYSKYISSYINEKKDDINFYKNEFLFHSNYKWLIYNKDTKPGEKNKYLIYELSIEFPKIKLKILNKETTIKNIFKKTLLIKLMANNFEMWDKTVLFELFYIKRIRNIINSLKTPDTKYEKQKINIFPFFIIKNQNEKEDKIFQFFISDINKKVSRYYIFNPYKIILSEKGKKLRQEIQLNLKESRILYKFKNIWGTNNALLKCISIDTIKNKNNENDIKINYKFDITNIPKEYMKNFEKNIVEDKNKLAINNIVINLINCSLKRIIINNNNKCVEKLFEIKQEFINMILGKQNGIINNLFYEKMEKFCEDFLKENELIIKIKSKKKHLIEENEKNQENENESQLLIKKRGNLTIDRNKKNYNLKQSKLSLKGSINSKNKNMKNYINKKRVFSANVSSKNKNDIKNIKNKEVKDTLFLTKNLSNNLVGELYPSESESSEEPSFTEKYKYIKSFNSKSVNQIRNQKDLKQDRIMRNCFLFKNDFNLKKLRRIMSCLKRKKEEENIHNK